MRKIRIAQIGANTNSHSCAVLASLRKQSDLFEVVGYALPENERKRIPYKTAGYDGLTEMTVEEILRDPTIEAVTVELKPPEWYVPDSTDLWTGRTVRTGDGWHEWGEESKSTPHDRYDNMMAAFAAIVRGERENPYTPDYELTVFKTVPAACRVG